MGENLGLVPFEFIEIPQNEFIVSVGFFVVFGDLGLLLEAFLVLGGEFGQTELEVVESALEFSAFLLPRSFVFLLAAVDILQLVFEVFVAGGLVFEAGVEGVEFLVELVHLLVVFVLHLVAHVSERLQLVVEFAGLGNQVHVVRVQLFVFRTLLVDAVAVLVGHAFETADQVLVLVVQLRVARIVLGQALLQVLDLLVQAVDSFVFVFLLSLESLAGLVQFLVFIVEAQLEFFFLQIDLVEILVCLLQFVGQRLVVFVDVLE